ncbi:hypothetical protein JCM19235_5200 [Vibrio maritimus]|uniref:Uncharacterized protein n=1 Tax=Vibrio maritimus TaxID=990268 RepID=A0A090RN24_9VIBR|nr:hypothetical protein JCM19235_5200 [Vibrio maritimus]
MHDKLSTSALAKQRQLEPKTLFNELKQVGTSFGMIQIGC